MSVYIKENPTQVKLEFEIDPDLYRALQAYLKKDARLTEEDVKGFYLHIIGQSHEALKQRFLGHKRLVLPRYMWKPAPNTKPLNYRGVQLNGKPLNDPFDPRNLKK